MEEIWFIGPLMIKEKWILYIIATLIGYIVLKVATKTKGIDLRVIESIPNAVMVFLVVWKVSYAIFHPIQTVNNPISLLYFTGGEKGVVLGFIAVLGYYYIRCKKEGLSYSVYIEMSLITLLAALGTYEIGKLVIGEPIPVIGLFNIALYFILSLYWWMKYRVNKPLWQDILLWFGLGELALSYFKIQIPILVGLSFNQWVYIAISLIGIFFYYKKPNFKKS